MKKRWVGIIVLAIVLATLFLPAAKVYVHSQLGEETAALFPKTVSVGDIMLKGADCLPTAEVPQLGLITFDNWMLIAGLVLLALAAAALVAGERGTRVSIVLSFLSIALTFTFSLQVTNICGSILFTLLLENQAWIYAPAIGGLIMVVLGFVGLKEAPAMKITDRTFRLASGVLAILAMLCLLLPSHVVSVPESITADPADAAAMNRSTPLWKEMLGNEPNLRAEVAEKGVYGSVLTGDIEVLVPYSNDANNIQGIFTIGSSTAAPNAYLIAAMILLALTALFLVTAVSVRLLTPRAAASQYTVEALTPSEETEENRVNINTASASELDALPGIGPVLAQRIIDRRTEQGPFTSVEELLEVDGIGQATLDGLREFITVKETKG